MTQEQLLNTLGITGDKKDVTGDSTTISTTDSNLYSKWYTILDRSDLVDLLSDNMLIDMNQTRLVYEGDEYSITLESDFENNVYKLTVKEL